MRKLKFQVRVLNLPKVNILLTKYLVLKSTLKNMFSQYGEVLDVVAYSNIRMRGQAFVAYADEESAAKAIKELQHFALYGKPMVSAKRQNKNLEN